LSKPKTAIEILTKTCEAYGVELERMYEPGNGHPCSEVRGMTAMIIQDNESLTLTSLAKELGRELSALSKTAERVRQRIRGEDAMKKRHAEILNALKKSTIQA